MYGLIDNINGLYSDYHIVLSTRNFTHLGEINTIDEDSIDINLNFNSADEISFTVYKYLDDVECAIWDKILDLKLIYVVELDEYFQIQSSITDSENITKSITGTSLCEAELGQILLVDTNINNEDDIAREDYEVTRFYNPSKPTGSLLHRILKKAPHYSIGHVDKSLYNLQRTFTIDGTSIYDFIQGDMTDQFNCMPVFDTTTRTINFYDLYTVCEDCDYRGDFYDTCPECGSTNLKCYGEDTTIFVDSDNLTDSISYTTNVDSIKNCFRLEAGDDTMTAAVIANNPNGSSYLWSFSDLQTSDMSDELVAKIKEYNTLYEKRQPTYTALMNNIYGCIDKIYYYTNSMMPTIEHAEVTAKTEAAKLTASNLSPLGLSSVTKSTSVATVNSAIKNYGNVYVKQGYVKLEIDSGSFEYEGTDSDGNNYGYWKGRIKVTNYSDETDIAYSDYLNIKVYDLYEDFLRQKIKKSIAKDNDDEGMIFDVLAIEDLSKFKTALTYYSLVRLQSFYDAIQGCLDIMIEADQASALADLYKQLYVPYKNKLDACQAEIDKRQATIDSYESKYDGYLKEQQAIQKELDLESFLGEKLFLEFSAYRREDTYSNSNYISDGLENNELFDKAQEFLKVAKEEASKASTPQHSISSDLYNLLSIPEFEPIRKYFKLGNWIRLSVDGNVYRLRLIKIGLANGDLTNITTEFSNLTVAPNVMSDVQSILASAQSMATSFSYVAKQAENGNEAKSTLSDIQQEGLNSALYTIKNSNTEEITYGKHGLLARSYNDEIDDYDDEQFKITHNVLAFTDDNWTSVRSALGKQRYTLNGVEYDEYGLNADFMISGKMIAGDIYSQNYDENDESSGTHINLNDGSFEFAGKKLTYDASSNKLKISGNIEGGSLFIGSKTFGNYAEIDSNGNMTVRGLTVIDGVFKQAEKGTTFQDAVLENPTIAGGYISMSNSAGDISTSISHGQLVARNGDFQGYIESTVGLLGGLNITEDGLRGDYSSNCAGFYSTGYPFWAGGSSTKRSSAPFRVSQNGDLYFENANVSSSGSSKSTFTINNVGITGYNTSKNLTVAIYNTGKVMLYDSTGGNDATFSSSLIKLTDTSSKLVVAGTKSRVADTENYNKRLLYCYETPTPMFGDVGMGETDDTGSCVIYIDPVFAETINTRSCTYYVFITPYGKGDLYVAETTQDYFIINGDANMKFSWEIKAKQNGFESLRLEDIELGQADYAESKDPLLDDINNWVDSILQEEMDYE